MSYTSTALGFTMPATVLDYMREVDVEIGSLDADVAKFTPSQSFLGEWSDFVNASLQPVDGAPPRGWRSFYKEYSGLSRFTNSDVVYKRTGEFEWRLIEFYDKFVSLGGKPSMARPKPGHVPPPPEDRPGSTALKFITWTLVIAGVVGVGYLLRSLPKKAEKNPKRISAKRIKQRRIARRVPLEVGQMVQVVINNKIAWGGRIEYIRGGYVGIRDYLGHGPYEVKPELVEIDPT